MIFNFCITVKLVMFLQRISILVGLYESASEQRTLSLIRVMETYETHFVWLFDHRAFDLTSRSTGQHNNASTDSSSVGLNIQSSLKVWSTHSTILSTPFTYPLMSSFCSSPSAVNCCQSIDAWSTSHRFTVAAVVKIFGAFSSSPTNVQLAHFYMVP